jgi:hypothetical protein
MIAVEVTLYIDCKALSAVFVYNRQQPKRSTVIGAILHEIVAPNVVAVFRSKSHTRAVV